MNSGAGVIRNGALGVQDGLICWIGKDSEIPSDLEVSREIDGKGQWLTPGLIDCHTHLVFAGDRAAECELRQRGVSYQEIAAKGGGILSTVGATREAGVDELTEAAGIRAKAFKNEGVTTLDIKSGYGLDLDTELKMLKVAKAIGKRLGLRVRTGFLGAHAVPYEYSGKSSEYIDFVVAEMLPVVAQNGLADYVDVFCECVGFTPEQTRRVFDCAGRLGLPVRLHADQLSDLGGGGLAAEYGALSADHLEYVSENSVRMMGNSGTVAVMLPGAFLTLKEERRPPIELFRKHGVKMAVSTDCNPGTSPTTSLHLMMNAAVNCFGLTYEEVWLGVTTHAAFALGLGDRIGQLMVGMEADLCLWPVDELRQVPYWMGQRIAPKVIRSGFEPEQDESGG